MTLPRDIPVHLPPVPRLETERLLLRGPEARDFPLLVDFQTDAARMRFIGGALGSEFDVWGSFMRAVGHWAWHGYGFWTLEDKATGQAVGRVGIVHHVGWPEPELGWHAFAAGEGRGMVFEAALAIRDFAGRQLGLDRIISQIHPDNARSRALAERMGARIESETELLGDPCLIYRHPSVSETA